MSILGKIKDLTLSDKKTKDDEVVPIVKEEIKLPAGFEGLYAFVLHNVLTPQECKDYIKKTEAMGYSPALITVGSGAQILATDIRNNERVIWHSQEEADKWWERVKDFVCQEFEGHQVIGLNDRLSFLKYGKGEYFKPHYDGAREHDTGESMLTFQLYLNEGFEGGSTTFISNKDSTDRVECVPKTGSVLIFQHDILHEGSLLVKGRKYTCRTDIMFYP